MRLEQCKKWHSVDLITVPMSESGIDWLRGLAPHGGECKCGDRIWIERLLPGLRVGWWVCIFSVLISFFWIPIFITFCNYCTLVLFIWQYHSSLLFIRIYFCRIRHLVLDPPLNSRLHRRTLILLIPRTFSVKVFLSFIFIPIFIVPLDISIEKVFHTSSGHFYARNLGLFLGYRYVPAKSSFTVLDGSESPIDDFECLKPEAWQRRMRMPLLLPVFIAFPLLTDPSILILNRRSLFHPLWVPPLTPRTLLIYIILLLMLLYLRLPDLLRVVGLCMCLRSRRPRSQIR